MKKIVALILSIVMVFVIIVPAYAAPLPVVSFYGFQPDGTPYHYYSFGDEVFYNICYDGVDKCYGDSLVGFPKGVNPDGWLRDTMLVNGAYQLVNARYKLDTPDRAAYPATNRNMLLTVTAEGQNGSANFNAETSEITLYMKPASNLEAPEMEVVVTSLGYQYFHGPVWWSLTNDAAEKEKLKELYNAGLEGDTFLYKDSWEPFGELFIATMENNVDLSKETWLTVCGGTIGGYFYPVFEQYKLICVTGENPILKVPALAPRTAEFDKRLLYQANVIFTLTDYTRKPIACSINGNMSPANAVSFNDSMCVVDREYLASVSTGDTISLTVGFDDGSEDTVKVTIKDTTSMAFKPVFSDVGTSTTAWEYINPLVEKGIIEKSNDKFLPENAITYAEFYSFLTNLGIKGDPQPSPSALMPVDEGERLLFSILKSKPFEAKYIALNKQHLWLPNVYGDLTSDNFAFFDMVLSDPGERVWGGVNKSDTEKLFTRAQAAEAIYRFVRLTEYADELSALQNPMAIPTPSAVLLNGKSIIFDAYNISGANYFKLRDLAYVLNGTDKQFAIEYDNETKRISVLTGNSYTQLGGEMSSRGKDAKIAALSSVGVYFDRMYSEMWAYNIGGNNYFKLREIAKALDFSVEYDAATKTIIIDTTKGVILD